MSCILSAIQISDIIGVDRRSVLRRAETEGWAFDYVPSRGGPQKVFPLISLPAEIRDAVSRHRLQSSQAPQLPAVVETAPSRPATALTDYQRKIMSARLAVLGALDALQADGLSQAAALRMLVAMAAEGTLPDHLTKQITIANARSGEDRTLSIPTLKRWLGEYKAGGEVALAPKAAPARLDPPWADALLKLWQRPTSPALAAILADELAKDLPVGCPMPSYNQARAYISGLPITVRERGRKGPMALLAVKGMKRRSTAKFSPMDIVTADGHTFKARVAHPLVPKKTIQPEVTTCLDAVTRYICGWSIGLSESTWTVADAIRHAVETMGQFALFYTDNGSGFVNHCLTDEVLGVLSRVGATPTTAIAYRAQARGKIERLQRSVWRRAARKVVTYVGRDMDREAQRAIERRIEVDLREDGASSILMTWDDFRGYVAGEVDAYNRRPHRGLPTITDAVTGKRRHMSPAEALQAHVDAGWGPQMLTPAIIDDLFRPYEIRKTFRGEVNLAWGRYYHDLLVDYGGQSVRVGYDIKDGSRVWVRDNTGRLICVAIRDANVIDEQPVNKVEHALEKRAATREKLLQQHIEDVRAEKRSVRLIDVTALTPEQQETLERISLPAPMEPVQSDEDRWYGRAMRLEAQLSAGAELDPDDLEWLTTARTLDWYQSRQHLERLSRSTLHLLEA